MAFKLEKSWGFYQDDVVFNKISSISLLILFHTCHLSNANASGNVGYISISAVAIMPRAVR